jgi:tetratricopeptide (TPR) repeat protein
MKDVSLDLKQFQMKDGRLNDGRLARYWRKEVIQWHNTSTLVDLYNECLEETCGPISIRWWQRMEKENKLPKDLKRRWVIATLLHIPPAYLGLTALDPLLPHLGTLKISPTASPGPIDVISYETRLGEIWSSPYETLDEVFLRINFLQDNLLYGTDQQKKTAAPLLSQYLLLFGNMHRARGDLSTAIAYLDRAITLAEEKKYLDVYAKALYLRGYTLYERWRTSLKSNEERTDFHAALCDLSVAEGVARGTSWMALNGAILGLKGTLLAYQTQDQHDRSQVVKVTREAGTIISSSSFRQDQYFLTIDKEWYHIGQAKAYAVYNAPRKLDKNLSM